MSLIEEVRAAWGWCGIDPVEIVGENDFGNLMVKDALGALLEVVPRGSLLQSGGARSR